MIFLYAFVNMAMVMSLIPVVGVPLPLVSYGGTAMLTVCFGLGVCFVRAHQSRGLDQPGGRCWRLKRAHCGANPSRRAPFRSICAFLGGRELKGFVDIAGAKNSVLPCMAAVLLTDSSVHLGNVPVLEDVQTMRALLGALGVDIKEEKKSPKLSSAGLPSAELGGGNARRMLALRAGAGKAGEIPAHLVARMRASILVLGPLLARYGAARLALPGGCVLGKRPVDLHCWALERLGAEIQIEQNTIRARVPNRLQGCEIAFPFCSVGATQNALMASVLASGTTRLRNAAREPEIVDLVRVLTRMGARISGAGTSTLCIEGVAALSGARHCVIPDRLEAGSMILAAMATGGGLRLAPVVPAHLQPLLDILPALGGEFALEAWEAGGERGGRADCEAHGECLADWRIANGAMAGVSDRFAAAIARCFVSGPGGKPPCRDGL